MAWERSALEREANSIDMEIYRLADRIERMGSEWLSGTKSLETSEAARKIRSVRGYIRLHMHPKDRGGTEG